MSSEKQAIYEFGPFQLDSAERVLRRDGVQVPLTGKVFDTLLALVERAGHTIPSEELIRRVWPDTSAAKNNLDQNVFVLRKALGDSTTSPLYIETVKGRGYRFVAGVMPVAASPDGRPRESHPSVAGGNGYMRRDDVAAAPAVAGETSALTPGRGASELSPVGRRGGRIGVAVAILLLLSGLVYVMLKPARSGGPAVAPSGKQVLRLTHNGKTGGGVISPDGRYLAYATQDPAGLWSVWLRDLESSAERRLLPPNEKGYGGVTFSPDSQTLYFTGPGDVNMNDFLQSPLYRVPVSGGKPHRVTIGVNSPVTFSPDGRRIAFVRRNPTLKEASLILANEDGSGEQTLTAVRWPTVFYFPSWSPDGKLIALGRRSLDDQGYHAGAIAVRVEGGEVETLTTQRWEALVAVKWLGDGSGILATAVDRPGQPMQVWEISYPGGRARNVTEDANDYAFYELSVTADSGRMVLVENTIVAGVWVAQEGRPEALRQLPTDNGGGFRGVSWTPDGKLLYTSRSPDRWDIWQMDADGSGHTRLTVNAGNNHYPSASRDGRHVVFTSDRGGRFNVWRMGRDGSNPTRLTDGVFDDFPCFTPDGKWVVYRSTDKDDRRLWKVPAAGGKPVQLTDKYTYPPTVSPDGQLIAFFYTLGALRGLAVMPVEGGEPVKTFDLLPNPTDPENPFSQVIRWTPDGLAVSYMDHQKGVSNIWSQPLAGGPPQQVTHFSAQRNFFFDWSDDGGRLVLSRGERVQDIVLVSNFR